MGDCSPSADRTEPNNRTANVVREVPLPANWYLGMHGDPIAQFDSIILRLHEDGTVTWLDALEASRYNGRGEG